MTTSKVRLWTSASLTLVPTVALIIARLAWGDNLPETVASHWSGSTPDGFSTTSTFFAWSLTLSVIAVAIAITVAIRQSDNAPLFLALTSITSATFATIWILSVALTLDAGSAQDARLGWWIIAPIAAMAVGIAAYLLIDRQRAEGDSPLPTPTLDTPLAATERAVWIGQARSVWPWLIAVAMTGLAVATAVYSQWWVAAIMGLTTIVTTAFASVTVRVNRQGVTISSWGVRWKKIPVARIRSASMDDIRPSDWGGWGYRLSSKGTAVVLRSGAAIVLILENGRQFAVTVDNPEGGVRLINSLIQARTS
ncbi:hypothetical protein ABH922_001881 [Rhodococcus sp. 27YEA15]|uniref:hypothetical protein n=1 Tax=Rhodococcus sp. 27YEA15 TaxID=3156259 RepID=UPI003C7CD32F